MTSIYNTMEVGPITATIGGVLAFAIGYTVTRTRTRRGWIDVIATIPVAIPGLVIGVAYLWAWIGIPSASTAPSGSWPWPSPPASCPTRSRRCPPR